MSKSSFDKIAEKYGATGTYTKKKVEEKKKDEGKQSKVSAPQSSKKSSFDKIAEKYGATGTYKPTNSTPSGSKKKLTDFNAETKNTYTSFKDKRNDLFTKGLQTTAPLPSKESNEPLRVKHDDDYWQARYEEELERQRIEHANDPIFPVAAHAVAVVDEERKREEYITKYQDKLYEDDFWGQFAASFRLGDISEKSNAADIDYLKSGDKADWEYATELNELAERVKENNKEVFADDATLPWISQDTAGYLPQFINRAVPQAIGGVFGGIVGGGIGLAATAETGGFGVVPGAKIGAKAGATMASGVDSYDSMKASAFRGLVELGADEETARAAANDEAILGAITEMGDTWFTLSKLGYAGVLNLIGKDTSKQAAKGGLKKLATLLGKYGLNIEQERAEEGVQGAISIANQRRVLNGEYDKQDLWGLTKDAVNVLVGADFGTEDAETIKEIDESKDAGGIIAAVMGLPGTAFDAAATGYVEHQNAKVGKVVDAVIETGLKADSESEAHKKAEVIKSKKDAGEAISNEELVDAVQEITSEIKRVAIKQATVKTTRNMTAEKNSTSVLEVLENRKRGKVNAELLDTLTQANEPITAEEVKKATIFGDNGAKLVAELANKEGATFSQAERTVKAAYMAGFTNVDSKQVSFTTDTQINAYTAGKQDRVMQDLADKERAKNAVVNKNSGFVAKNLPSDVTPAQVEILDIMSKGLGYKSFVTKGLKGNAEIHHDTGEAAIDFNFERKHNGQDVSIVFHAAHEMAMHGVVTRAPEEGKAFVYAMYRHLAGKETSLPTTLADEKRIEYGRQDVEISLSQAMEEISANNILYLYGNDEGKFHKAIESIVNGNDVKAKQGLSKYLDYLKEMIRKIRNAITGKKGKARAELQAELNEVTKLRDMFEAAVAKAVESTRAVQSQEQTKSETKGNQNGISYSIREEYANEIETWVKEGKPDGENFILGTTGDVLQGLGAIESDIYMLGDKIKEILNDHPEITIDEIKKIPQILDDPVMVIKSKQIKSRLVMFGSIKAQNGKPILVVLDLRPHEKGFMLNDMQKVNSAYTKTETFNRTAEENGRDFVEKSEILYLDKKRTTYLLSAIGFYMPITCNQSGFIGSITYEGDNVNIKGEDFSKVFKETTKSVKTDFSLKDSEGNTLSKEQSEFFTSNEYDNDDIRYSLQESINQSMTMEQAKDMIQRAFVIGEIKEWFDGEYQNGDEWLKGEGADAVAMVVENEWTLQQKFLNKIQGIMDDEFYVADIIEAYEKGTLTGKVKQNVVKRLDTSKSTNATDTRVFAPKDIKNAQELYKVASERVTNSNREKVQQARADIIMFAHTRGAAEALGLTQSELNKKLATWARYTARAREVSMRINNDVSLFNKWTGIENSNILNRATVSQSELDNLVNEVKGDSNGWQRNYIMRTMLALDTHIDYSELNFEFVGTPKASMGKSVNGLYDNSHRKITVKYNAPHTVSHEMGHFLDYQWARDLGCSGALTEGFGRDKQTDADIKQFLTNFDEFIEQIENVADLRSEYTMDRKEVFARFVAKFVQWVDLVANGKRSYAQEYLSYNDKFTASQYIEFVRLLQEKSMLDAKRMESTDISYSLKDSEGKALTAEQQEYFKDSKIRDKDGNLLVMYHGTTRGGFTVFGGKKDYWYFTNDKKYAYTFEGRKKNGQFYPFTKERMEKGEVTPQRYKVYLNVTNPHIADIDTVEDALYWDKSLAGLLREKGYDALMVEDMSQVIVLNANQIKDTTNKNPSANPDINFSLKGVSETNTKDRKQLIEVIEHLKGEFELTKFAKADQKKLAKMTRDILKEYSSQADFNNTFKAIDELYLYMANGEDGHSPVWEDVYSRAYDIATKIVDHALVVDNYAYQEYKHLRDYLRTTPMKFDSEYDSVPSSYENFNEFRKMNMGRLKFTKDGASIDSVYQELAQLYPEFFDAEEQINSADQLERMLDVLDDLQPTEVNPFEREFRQASMYLASDIASRFFDIPQAKPTFADKAERRVVEARIAGAKKVEAVRQQKDEKIKKLIETQREKTKKQLSKIREQRDAKVAKEQAKRRDAIAKMSENQKVKVLRARIMRHTSDLNKKLLNPTDNQHIPQELQGAVAKLLECINLESNYTYDTESHSYKKNDEGLPTKRTQAFNELKKVYADIASSIVVDPDLVGEYGLLSGVISLADKRIVDMTSSELDTVWQAIRAIEASVNTANKLFSEGKFATILEIAEALRASNEGKVSKTEFKGVIGKGKKLVALDMLTPETYLHYLGNAGDSVFRMMRDAQDKHISIMKEVADFTHKALNGVDVNSLENTIHTVKLGGEDVQLSTAQIMELYVLMNREQAVEHILVGGILPDAINTKGLKQITKTKPVRNISVAEISKAISKLTDEQKKVADKLQRYVSTVLSAYGNEASMQVYNYEKFTEKNYWTIRTNRQEIKSDVDKDTAVTSVANKGMTKATKPHANTSVRIGSIFDTFASHSSDMATYAAWLGTSEDVNRIRNFVFWENGARTGTVKDILDTVHGTHGSQYLEKLLTDIAIGVKGTDNLNPFDRLVGHYKAASVGANLRVIIQQPTAIIRALDMIDAKYLAEGTLRPLKGWEKAKKYAPIAQWKDWGHFDINTGRQMKDVLFDNASLLEKTKQVGMWGASTADSLAWGQLWNAVELETRATHKDLAVGSEEYFQTVAKRFTEIVDHTQVVDGILQRSQIMRSADSLTKMATSFMGEPTKQYNMAMSAYYDYATAEKGDARKKAAASLGRTALSLATAGIINACAQSIIDAMRDDDKEKDYWEKWLANFGANALDVVNVFNYIPYIKDIISIISGYSVTRMDTAALEKVRNAVVNMVKAATGTGKYTIAEASAALFAETAKLYGLPVANVKRDVKSLVMSVAIKTDSYLMQYRMEKAMLDINYAGNSKNFMDILYNAYNNDKKAYESIYNDMLKSGYEVDKIKSGMNTRMMKAEGVKKVSDLSKRYMTPANEKKYDKSLNKVKTKKVWKSANAEQKKNAQADLYDFLTSTSKDMQEIRAEAKSLGIDETEYTLWQLAKDVVNDKKAAISTKERAAAIKQLDLDSETEWALYKFRNKVSKGAAYAYEHGIDSDTYADFIAALEKYDKPNKNGNLGTYTQEEERRAVNSLKGLSSKERSILYKSVNLSSK